MLEKLLQWDQDAFIYLNSLGIEKYDAFWLFVTEIHNWIPLFLLFLVLFVLKFPRKQALFHIAIVVLQTWFIIFFTNLVKNWVKRARPSNDEILGGLIRILKTPNDYSFFSGHASSSFAITFLVYLLLREKVKWAWIFFIWPLLFAMSRIYVGVHYPSDILVGASIGTLSAFAFYGIYKKVSEPYIRSNHP